MSDIDRKLATVRRIAAIDPIPGADAIVKLTVDGWELVSQKSNGFKVGDLVLYLEVDSFLPVREEFEFLRDRCFKSTKNLGDGFRLRTIKLRGQVSQGLALPLNDFFYATNDGRWYYMTPVILEVTGMQDEVAEYVTEGTDVTDFLGIQKYEKPIPANLAGKVRGNFPMFLQKTDQERIQNCFSGVKNWVFNDKPLTDVITDQAEIDILEMKEGDVHEFDGVTYYKSESTWLARRTVPLSEEDVASHSKFEATLKLDGSSMTMYHNESTLGVCSRNLDLTRSDENLFWSTALMSKMPEYLFHLGRNLAVQGELMGPDVQGNREELERHCVYIFDVYDIDAKRYFTPEERAKFWQDAKHHVNTIAIAHAPIIHPNFVFERDLTVPDVVAMTNQVRSLNHEIAEGVVFKSHLVGGPTFKCISSKFLLGEKD